MWSKLFGARWRGALLALTGIAAILWLALTGRLGWYIHPRYFAFTVTMAVIAATVTVLAFAVLARGGSSEAEHEHDGNAHERAHEHGHGAGGGERRSGWGTAATAVLVLLGTVALLVMPPATLTTATVEQRQINSGAQLTGETASLDGVAEEDLTVRDWSILLRQSADSGIVGRSATLIGFITPEPEDPDNVFYVARFVVNCCAVDAQPVGVPVHMPGWQDEFAQDQWVELTGSFMPNPSPTSRWPFVLRAASVERIEAPEDPYVY